MKNLIMVLDTETTGLDPDANELTEVCCAIVDVDLAKIQSIWSRVCQFEQQTPEALELTGIVPELATCTREQIGDLVKRSAHGVRAVLAHNASFDRKWLPELADVPWVCTLNDFPWGFKVRGLADLALKSGVGIVRAHRAFDDVITLATVLERQGDKLAEQIDWVLEDLKIPRIPVSAIVSIQRKDEAKAAGFRWNPTLKIWWREIKETEIEALPFQVQMLRECPKD